MMAIGSYFVFIIIVMGTLLSAQELSDEEKQYYSKDILEAHNKYRKKHGSNPLNLDKEMCEKAMELVEEWIENSGTLKIPNEYGSNSISIGLSDNDILDTQLLIESWYTYESIYDYNYEPPSRKPTNPFTQIVWKNTERLGVGIYRKDNLFGVLVLYYPAGNQIGQYESNVINPHEAKWQKMQLTDIEEQKFIDDILTAHNYYRNMHSLPNLFLDEELCGMAKIRVREWMTNPFETPQNEYGVYYDKIFFDFKSTLSPTEIVRKWYESNKYEYIKNPLTPQPENPFTQHIWSGTEKIGVGILVIGSYLHITVMYSPGGNQSGSIVECESSSRNC